jgi:hypothetical protein
MLARTLIAAALLTAPALALAGPDSGPPETKIRNMAEYIEADVDPRRGIYIQGYTGQWYYARVRGECPRLNRFARLRFNPSPGGDFDRFSSIRADGFHCFVESVTEVAGPPRRQS